ncbi:hypothetical protein [Streptosporangium sp. NPDC000396]|uniref:hypothetical protein n=1 Tax=Streptosporangium sp. NPDC000396 TaxID=3366185 RepID=UPI003699DBE1
MRRYRFGRIATLFAAIYVAVVIVSGVRALATGDPALLREIVTGGWDTDLVPYAWWVELLMVAGGVLQGWAYWQILRGRPTGAAAVNDRPVRLLRAALYLSVTCTLLYRLPLPYQWWLGLPFDLLQIAFVGLFFVVLADVLPRWLRLLGLVAGLANAAMSMASTFAYGLGQYSVLQFVSPYQLGNAVYLLWLVPVLVGQDRHARWTRGTVRMGAASALLSLLSSGSGSFISFGGWGVDYNLLLVMVLGIMGVLGTVWQARSAHDLGVLTPVPSAAPAVQVAPARAWSLAAVAVVLPLIPAAVNLADGMPSWIGPRGAVDDLFHGHVSYPATVLWVALDMLIGAGAPAVLILIAVMRRTRRLLRVTMLTLTLAAAAGIVTALTTKSEADWQLTPEMTEQRLALYPDGLFDPNDKGEILFGISPLWYSAALAASALVLFLLYRFPSTARSRHHVLVAALAASMALCFLPAADQSRGRVTTAEDCSSFEARETNGELAEPSPPTDPRAFICAVRRQHTFPFAATAPDQVLLDHGHRLCAAYTRNDPRELARLQEVEGVNIRSLSRVLSGICPAAKAEIAAEAAAENREFNEFMAEEQRKCDATPRHRPLIKPAKAIRLKEPQWPEAGLELYDEFPGEGKSATSGPVTAAPGYVTVSTDSDFHVCVTLETYTRRPPIETKGWDNVVEVGYANQSGEMSFTDGLSGTELPDLSLNGRKGHYRIRLHLAWFPWKGEEDGTQRLLIMAYPGPGDKVVTYRRPPKRR